MGFRVTIYKGSGFRVLGFRQVAVLHGPVGHFLPALSNTCYEPTNV